MKKPVAFYKIDDLFKHGDLLYDKLNDQIFIYDQLKHKDNIRNSPNNYRKGHRGDFKGKPSNTGEMIYNKYIKNRLV